jgi:hypothetical protein
MGREGTRLDRRAWKQNQESVFGNPDFIRQRVLALLPEFAGATNSPEWRFEVIRNKAAGRSTLLYSAGESAQIYGKAYFDFAAADEAYRSLRHLWANGFANGSMLEVPEPLGIVAEANLVLMRPARGGAMDQRAGNVPLEEALSDARLAARWLVKFQDAKIPGLRAESPCEKLEILKLADAVAKVAAECPEQSGLLIDMIHDLRAVAPKGNVLPALAPSHGQFRPAHVFIEGNSATVIDVEKLCLSDPAKDVARFCHVLKKTCLEEQGDPARAERISQEFVAEYAAHRAAGLENLAYFRALLAFKAFAKLLKNKKVDEGLRESMGQAYREEFELWVRKGAASEMAA